MTSAEPTSESLSRICGKKAREEILKEADLVYLRHEAEGALECFSAFYASNSYVLGLEQRKAIQAGLSADEEREAYERAVSGAQYLRRSAASTLRLVRHLQATGGWVHIWKKMEALLTHQPEIELRDMWQTVINNETAFSYIRDNLKMDYLLEDITSLLDDVPQRFRSVDGRLFVKGVGEKELRPVVTNPADKKIRHASDLWDQDILDTCIRALETPGMLGVTVFTPEDGIEARPGQQFDPAETMAMEAIRAVEQIEHDAALIGHTGLPASRGHAVVLGTGTAALIGLIIAAIGVVILIICEIEEVDETVCDIGLILTIIGAALVGGAACVELALCKGVIRITISGVELLTIIITPA